MKLSYDSEVDALYIEISDAPIVISVESPSGVIVELDAQGWVIAVEILDLHLRLVENDLLLDPTLDDAKWMKRNQID